jgi:hypothetical protein
MVASDENRVLTSRQAVEKQSNLPQLVFLFHFDLEHIQKLFLKIIAQCLVLLDIGICS